MIYFKVMSAIILLLSLVLQGHPSFDAIRFSGIKPDLVFIFVVYVGYSFGSFYGEVSGFFGGLLHDSISSSPLGLLAFPKMAIGFVVGLFGRSMIKSNIMTAFLIVFFASLLKGIITLFMAYIFEDAMVSAITEVILPESFYNALLAPILFFLYDKIFSKDLDSEGYM